MELIFEFIGKFTIVYLVLGLLAVGYGFQAAIKPGDKIGTALLMYIYLVCWPVILIQAIFPSLSGVFDMDSPTDKKEEPAREEETASISDQDIDRAAGEGEPE